jgi:hypothetical protein
MAKQEWTTGSEKADDDTSSESPTLRDELRAAFAAIFGRPTSRGPGFARVLRVPRCPHANALERVAIAVKIATPSTRNSAGDARRRPSDRRDRDPCWWMHDGIRGALDREEEIEGW